MSFHKRSTIERALARRHLKRLPAAVDPLSNDPAVAQPNPNASPDTPTVVATPTHRPPATLPATSIAADTLPGTPAGQSSSAIVTVLPPVGTDKVAAVTVVTSVVSSSSSTPATSSTSSVAPPPSSSSSSVQVTSTSLSSSSSSSTLTGNPSATSKSDAANAGSRASAASHGLSSSAVGGIVVLIIILTVAAVGLFVRRQFQHRRAVKRNTWGAGLVPALESKRDTIYPGQPFTGQSFTGQSIPPSGGVPEHERLPNVPRTSEMSQGRVPSNTPGLATPALSYNPGSPPPASPFFPASLHTPSVQSAPPSTYSGVAQASEIAVVARTFVPSLPDELHIANGEQIRILAAYDDGWALCSNLRGDQGVVPLECLEKLTSVPAEMQLQPQNEFASESNRTSRRLSSLAPKTAGTY